MLEYLKDVLLSSKRILEAVQEADFNRERGGNIFTSERNNQTQSNINMLTNESHLTKFKNNKKITSLLNLKNGLPRTALIFVVDINNEHSLAETISILSRIKDVEKEELYKTEKVVLLNKYDKSSEGKKVANIENKLDKFGVSYYYVSALTGFNIQKAFNNLILSLRRKYYSLSDN